nr:MAG TPA: hypothetical protein [Bacteriophage sp.]
MPFAGRRAGLNPAICCHIDQTISSPLSRGPPISGTKSLYLTSFRSSR